jgi:hypothetical protein
MEGATGAVLRLQQGMRDDRAVERMLRLIGSSWVDFRSTERIPLIARDPEGPRAMAVNASDAETARLYMVCAASNDSRSHDIGVVDQWFLAPALDVGGEAMVDNLVPRIHRSVAYALGGIPENTVQDVLDMLFPYKPVLVALPHGKWLTVKILAELRERIPGVTFFLLTGGQPDAEVLREAQVEVLVPELREGDEDAVLKAYKTLRTVALTRPA